MSLERRIQKKTTFRCHCEERSDVAISLVFFPVIPFAVRRIRESRDLCSGGCAFKAHKSAASLFYIIKHLLSLGIAFLFSTVILGQADRLEPRISAKQRNQPGLSARLSAPDNDLKKSPRFLESFIHNNKGC